MFANLIGKMVEVYVDDMLVKFLKTEDYVKHLNEDSDTLKVKDNA